MAHKSDDKAAEDRRRDEMRLAAGSAREVLERAIKAGEVAAAELEQSGDLWFVIVEWGGQQPPTTYYNWLGKLVGRVRKGRKKASQEQGHLTGRDDGKGIIFQESAIFVPSRSLAYGIGAMMRDWYPEVEVLVGRGSLVADFVTTDAGRETIRRTARVLSNRGRPRKAEAWAVTCLECLDTYQVMHSLPYQCPKCSGLNIGTRRGQRLQFVDDGRDVWELWLATRFQAGGRFEIARVDSTMGLPANIAPDLFTTDKAPMLVLLDASTDLVDAVRQMPRSTALSVLDGVFVARQFYRPEQRLPERVAAVTRFFSLGGSPAQVSLAEQPEPDLLDLAIVMGAETAGTLAWQQYGGGVR